MALPKPRSASSIQVPNTWWKLPDHIRSYEDALKYAPNQTYIGNMTPGELGAIAQPWYDKPLAEGPRYGKFGEIMPEESFTCSCRCVMYSTCCTWKRAL